MSQTVGDYLLERLATWGVERVYGYPGDGINGVMGAFIRSSNGRRPEFIQVRHEEMSAFMACAHGKFTGELGVCMATSGPGAIHLLNGLRALRGLLKRKEDRSWRQTIEREVAQWWNLIEQRAHLEADPVNPQLVFHELSKRLPDGAILAADSGSAANWYARDVKLRKGMLASLSGTLATMGPGVPYALAAKFAFPSRPVIAMVGDGAMQMNGINELVTIAKYRERWADQRLIVLVLNNRDLNQVTWEQRAMSGDPKFEGSQKLPDFPYARYAELLGLRGIRVDTPDRVGDAWDEALSSDRPVVYEAVTDPEVPPLPPHITIEQAKALSSALLGGDPNAGRIVRQAFKQKVQELLPGR